MLPAYLTPIDPRTSPPRQEGWSPRLDSPFLFAGSKQQASWNQDGLESEKMVKLGQDMNEESLDPKVGIDHLSGHKF
jgi:hypothetical protein